MKKHIAFLLTAICLLLAIQKPVKAEETSLKLIQTVLYADQGGQYNLQTDNLPASGLVWTSSDPSVVSVTNGTLQAKKAGYATISVSDSSDTSKSSTCQVVVKPKQITGVDRTKTKSTKIAIAWKENKNCSGYHVYLKKKGESRYQMVKDVAKPQAVLKDLSSESGYDICVAAYVDTPLGKIEGTRSQKVRLFTLPDAPKATRITKITKGKFSFYRGQRIRFFTVKWKKVKGANAYQVYCKSGSKQPQLLDTVKKNQTTLWAGVGYTYKIYVVPVRTKHGLTAAGKKSPVEAVQIVR